MKNKLKICRLILTFVFISGFIFSISQLTKQLNFSYTSTPELFIEPKAFSDVQCYYKDDEYIYLVGTKDGIVQIFSYQGNFIKGYKIPSNGGIVWAGSNELLHIYCVRSNILIKIDGEELEFIENVFYGNPNDFYESNFITNKTLCSIRGNVITINNDVRHTIQLSINRNVFSIDVCIVILIICIIGFLITSGLLKLILGKLSKQAEAINNPFYSNNSIKFNSKRK